jgi:ABC-type Fe3+/spermidine/putrescine transport system ATPase subunit
MVSEGSQTKMVNSDISNLLNKKMSRDDKYHQKIVRTRIKKIQNELKAAMKNLTKANAENLELKTTLDILRVDDHRQKIQIKDLEKTLSAVRWTLKKSEENACSLELGKEEAEKRAQISLIE